MSPQRILGIALLVIGVGAIIVGMNASHSVSDQVSNTFTGHFTQATTWYILGGIASGIVGLVMMMTGPGGKSV
jgi:Protein of unknown function (DUF3185)